MCGIYGVICPNEYQQKQAKCKLDTAVVRQSHKVLRHRGPDWEGELIRPDFYMAHHRLSIVDPAGGSQPITYDLKNSVCAGAKYALCVNGEIYNHRELKAEVLERLNLPIDSKSFGICSPMYPHDTYTYKTASDCEVILSLYDRAVNFRYSDRDDGMELIQDEYDLNVRLAESLLAINGIFAFILADEARGQYWIARDPIGIIPLYYGYDSIGALHFASEMKAFPADVIPHHFPPGHFMLVNNRDIGSRRPQPVKYYVDLDLDISTIRQFAEPMESQIEHYKVAVREALCTAVERQLMTDVPFGALLSGGLDSSLVCAIAVKALQKPSIRQTSHVTWDGQLRTFSIGLEGGNATDLIAAERAAKWLGTKHYNFTFTMDEGLAAIRDVIWHLETYDVTTIRASTPMFLLARKIKSMGIKMVLSGEGSDEIFGGYLYFLKAPNDSEHSRECVRRVGQLSLFDCLRANKSTMAWGVEARPPFLDTELVKLGLSMPACLKRYKNIEKWILREAFNVKNPVTGQPEYLPEDLLWRQKEQFSDGVGYGWIDRLKDEASAKVSDYLLSLAPERFPVNTPVTKEEYHYRTIFEELFPERGREYTVQKWIPKTDWAGVGYDPSGRAQSGHNAAI
jgi:asparagine synthase (glutamine-hydrolysing)